MDHTDRNVDGQAAAEFGYRLRGRATELGLTSATLGRQAAIPKQSMTGYWNGTRLPGSDRLFPLADALHLSARWLISGTGPRLPQKEVYDAEEADWVHVPIHDLRDFSDEGLGDAIGAAPIRRDWLNATLRTDSNLWLARLLADYPGAQLHEDQLVICQTLRREELRDRYVCLWRIGEAVVIGRYSATLDAAQATSPGGMAAFIDPSLGVASNELLVPPSRSGPDGPYHVIGRILGVMLRPI